MVSITVFLEEVGSLVTKSSEICDQGLCRMAKDWSNPERRWLSCLFWAEAEQAST